MDFELCWALSRRNSWKIDFWWDLEEFSSAATKVAYIRPCSWDFCGRCRKSSPSGWLTAVKGRAAVAAVAVSNSVRSGTAACARPRAEQAKMKIKPSAEQTPWNYRSQAVVARFLLPHPDWQSKRGWFGRATVGARVAEQWCARPRDVRRASWGWSAEQAFRRTRSQSKENWFARTFWYRR